MSREIRDVVAECMRRESQGLIRPLWADWQRFADDECEHVRRRADHLMRLFAELGLEVVRKGEGRKPETAPASRVIYQYGLVGQPVERVVRKAGADDWEIVTLAGGKETLEQTFTLTGAHINAGLVLTDAPEARAIPGLGRQLAALTEIYRVDAAGMGGDQ